MCVGDLSSNYTEFGGVYRFITLSWRLLVSTNRGWWESKESLLSVTSISAIVDKIIETSQEIFKKSKVGNLINVCAKWQPLGLKG